MQYFIKRKEKVNGPFTEAQIKSAVKSGKLIDTDLISNAEGGPWKTLEEALAKPQASAVKPRVAQGEQVDGKEFESSKAVQQQGEHAVRTSSRFALGELDSETTAASGGDELDLDAILKTERDLRASDADSAVETQYRDDPCPKCGELVHRGMLRCWKCGEFISSETAQEYESFTANQNLDVADTSTGPESAETDSAIDNATQQPTAEVENEVELAPIPSDDSIPLTTNPDTAAVAAALFNDEPIDDKDNVDPFAESILDDDVDQVAANDHVEAIKSELSPEQLGAEEAKVPQVPQENTTLVGPECASPIDLSRNAMKDKWYIQLKGRTLGPFSSSGLQRLVDDGRVNSDTLVRQGAAGKWTPAEETGASLMLDGSATQAAAPTPVPSTNPNFIACPDCGATVSKRAVACPQCGSPIAQQQNHLTPQPTMQQPEQKNNSETISEKTGAGKEQIKAIGTKALGAAQEVAEQVGSQAKQLKEETAQIMKEGGIKAAGTNLLQSLKKKENRAFSIFLCSVSAPILIAFVFLIWFGGGDSPDSVSIGSAVSDMLSGAKVTRVEIGAGDVTITDDEDDISHVKIECNNGLKIEADWKRNPYNDFGYDIYEPTVNQKYNRLAVMMTARRGIASYLRGEYN